MIIQADFEASTNLEKALVQCQEFISNTGCTGVRFIFNGVDCTVLKQTNYSLFYKAYQKAMKERTWRVYNNDSY